MSRYLNRSPKRLRSLFRSSRSLSQSAPHEHYRTKHNEMECGDKAYRVSPFVFSLLLSKGAYLKHNCRFFSTYKPGSPPMSESYVNKDKTFRVPQRGLMRQTTEDWGELSSSEKAEKYQRPKAQTTIDEEEVSKFSGLSALWWDEGGEFEALHSLNDLRVPLIRNGLVSQKTLDNYDITKPLDGLWILDVGSGGGILSEPLARLGASVIGLEASEENIKIAQAHLIHDPMIRDQIKYIHATVEDIAEDQAGKFDAVVASEVLEHVSDAETFVSSACQLVRPGGSIFFTTLNKTALSYALGIVVAERILRLVSPGTHDWQKFISPYDLRFILDRNNFSTRLLHGMWYNPLSKRWTWTKDTSINYAIHAVKSAQEVDVTSDSNPLEENEPNPQS